MVADISLESLTSPNLDVNPQNKKSIHEEPDSNPTSTESYCIFSPDDDIHLNNKRDFVNNSLNNMLSPKSVLMNINDWEYNMTDSVETMICEKEYAKGKEIDAYLDNSNVERESVVGQSSSCTDIGHTLDRIHSRTDIQSENVVNTELCDQQLQYKSDNENKLSSDKPDIVSSHEPKTKGLNESIHDVKNIYPVVNIKTLGNENDGSYEISIDNFFPGNVIPLPTCEANNHSNVNQAPYNKTHCGGGDLYPHQSIDFAKAQLHRTDNKQYRANIEHHQSFDDANRYEKTDYARVAFSLLHISQRSLSFPQHTLTSKAISPHDSVNVRDVFQQTPIILVESNGDPSAKQVRRRPRLLPKTPTDKEEKIRELANISFKRKIEINEFQNDSGELQDARDLSTTCTDDVSDICGENEHHRPCRPKSWCVGTSRQKSADFQKETMTWSAHSDEATAQNNGLPNTLSLASELCYAEEKECQLRINSDDSDDSPTDTSLPTPFCSTKELSNTEQHKHPTFFLEELGTPEVIEPACLADSGCHMEPDSVTPDQVKILNHVNRLRTEMKGNHNEKEIWLKGLISASFCNRCRSTGPFDIMQRSLTENLEELSTPTRKTPGDMYIDDDINSRRKPEQKLNFEFAKEQDPKGRYDLDKNALHLQFLQTPMDETVDPFPIPGRDEQPGPFLGELVEISLDCFEVTHRCCHKFIPRHNGELFMEIGDPLYVDNEEDDLWCRGLNLRTKRKGIFPSVCATDLNFQDGIGIKFIYKKLAENLTKMCSSFVLHKHFKIEIYYFADESGIKPVKYYLHFLGSLEIGANHKSTKTLQLAIDKIKNSIEQRRIKAPLRCLEINCYGIRMSNKVKAATLWHSHLFPPQETDSGCSSQSDELASSDQCTAKSPPEEHFFAVKNLSFCGCHPIDDRFCAFITKHPLQARFACHVLMGKESTTKTIDAIDRTFKTYVRQYLAASHPTEDIYLE